MKTEFAKILTFLVITSCFSFGLAGAPSGGGSSNDSGALYNYWLDSFYGQNGETGLETDDYRNVEVLIEDLNSDAANIGLTKRAIRTRVDLRLLESNLRPANRVLGGPRPFVYVNINVLEAALMEGAFTIEVTYNRIIYFDSYPNFYRGFGQTWSTQNIGTYGSDGASTYILESLDGMLDQFLRDYLVTNMD